MWPLRAPQRPPEALVTLTRATPPLGTLSPAQRRFWLGFWGGTFVTFGIIDVYRMTKHDGSTLSENIRHVFRTDTPEGKVLFLAALAVLGRHILDH